MSTRTVKASVLHGPRDIRVDSHDLPPPGPGEVQVAVLSTTLCGSDLHYFSHHRNGEILVREPLTLGHESAGRVVAAGPAVEGLAVGDLVALEMGLPCGSCEFCGSGRYNICRGMRFGSSARLVPHSQGTLREAMNHPAEWCHKLSPDTHADLGALLEPLSVAIHAHNRAGVQIEGSRVLVMGAGAVGLLCAAVSRARGARAIVVADVRRDRLDFALRHGFADAVVEVPIKKRAGVAERMTEGEWRDLVAERMGDAREVAGMAKGTVVGGEELGEVDLCFEGTGVESCLQTAIYATKPGGKVLLIGMGSATQTLPVSAASAREVDLVGVFRYANAYPKAIAMLAEKSAGVPDLRTLVTHRFRGVESAGEAFEMAARVADEDGNLVIKVVVEGGEQ